MADPLSPPEAPTRPNPFRLLLDVAEGDLSGLWRLTDDIAVRVGLDFSEPASPS